MSICPKIDKSVLPCRHYLRAERDGEAGHCKLPIYFRCVEAMTKKAPSLSHSAVNQYIRCKRAYYFSYIKGIQVYDVMKPGPMKIGAIWDSFQNSAYGGKPLNIDEEIKKYYGNDSHNFDVPKIKALISAFKDLEITTDLSSKTQSKSFFHAGNHVVSFVLDREYKDHFVETKCTSTQNVTDFFFSIHYLSQVATYFLANNKFKHAIMEVVKLPQLRSSGQYSKETPDEYGKRCYSDIVSRPSNYFQGYNKKTKTFGKKFMREEFNLKQLYDKYKTIGDEIIWRMSRGNDLAWYKEESSCLFPGKCLFYEICHTEGFPTNIYYIKEVPNE